MMNVLVDDTAWTAADAPREWSSPLTMSSMETLTKGAYLQASSVGMLLGLTSNNPFAHLVGGFAVQSFGLGEPDVDSFVQRDADAQNLYSADILDAKPRYFVRTELSLDGRIFSVIAIATPASRTPAVTAGRLLELTAVNPRIVNTEIEHRHLIATSHILVAIHDAGFASQFLAEVYSLAEKNDLHGATDLIFEFFDEKMTDGDFDTCNETLGQVDISRLPTELMRSFLTITLAGKNELPARAPLFQRIMDVVTQLKGPEKAKRIFGRLG